MNSRLYVFSILALACPWLLAACSKEEETIYVPTPTPPLISVEDFTGSDLDGSALNLGSVPPGQNGTPVPFYIRNSGGTALTGPGGSIAITVSGSDAAQFTVTPAAVASIPAGGSAAVTARLTPSAAHTAGGLTATVTVDSADPTRPQIAFTLSGTILAPAITSGAPASGPFLGGTSLTIDGAGFQSNATVTIGGTAATGVVVNAAGTQITCSTPAGSLGFADVVVTNGNTDADTALNGFEYLVLVVTSREDAFGVRQFYTADPALGAAAEVALTNYSSNAGLSFVDKEGATVVFSRISAFDLEYFSVNAAVPGTVISLTNRNNANTRTALSITAEAVPRILFREETAAGVWEIFSARTDGSDFSDANGAKRVSGLDMRESPTAGVPFLLTNESLPRVVFMNDANGFAYSARVDGADYGSEIQLVNSGSTNYLFGAAGNVVSGESAPRVVFRAASTGDDLWSVPADGSLVATRLTSGTVANPATYRSITAEATPRVIFYRNDAGNWRQLWSVQIDQTEANVLQLTNVATHVSIVTETQSGGHLGTGNPPRVVFARFDAGSGFDQVFSIPVNASSPETGILDLSGASVNAVYRGILPGTPDRVFFSHDDASLNVQMYIRNIDASDAGPLRVTTGDDAGGMEDSALWGIVGGRWVITKRLEQDGSIPSNEAQIYSWDLNASSNNEKRLTTWFATGNNIQLPNPWVYFNYPAGNRYMGLERTSGSVTQLFVVPADGSASPVQLTGSVNSSQGEELLY